MVITTDIVIFEAVYILQSPRHYGLSPARIRHLLEPLIALRGLRLPRKSLFARVFDLYCDRGVSFADAYHAAYMEARGIDEVYSYDTDFDLIAGISLRCPPVSAKCQRDLGTGDGSRRHRCHPPVRGLLG